MQLPHGWAIHPTNPAWAYEVANPANMQEVAKLTAQAAPPQPPPLPASMHGPLHDAPMGPPGFPTTQYLTQSSGPITPPGYGAPPSYGAPQHAAPQGYGAPAAAPAGNGPIDWTQYQAINTEQWADENETAVRAAMGYDSKATNFIWIDFEPVKTIGAKSILTARIVPDLFHGGSALSVPTSRHKMFTEYNPNYKGNKRVQFFNCLDQPGGPGNCPIDKAIEIIGGSGLQGAREHVDNFMPETTMCWQIILLDDIQRHYVQEVNDAGQPVIDPATGQPKWKLVPGVIRMKSTLNTAVRDLMRHHSDPSHPQFGYPIKLIREKFGPADMNVRYSAVNLEKSAIDPSLHPILSNAIDLKGEMLRFWKREDLEVIADSMLAKWGQSTRTQVQVPGAMPGAPPAGEQWLPHSQPGWEWNPATGQIRAAGAPPAPPAAYQPPQLPQLPPGPPAGPPQSPQLPYHPQAHMMGPGYQPNMAPPPAPAQPPQLPPSPPAQPPSGPAPSAGAYPPGPPGLPPPGAPGLPPGGPPAGMPPPPPGPGMPPGTMPQAAPPPPPQQPQQPQQQAPSVPQGGGMTPEQLEASFGGPAPGKTDDVPF